MKGLKLCIGILFKITWVESSDAPIWTMSNVDDEGAYYMPGIVLCYFTVITSFNSQPYEGGSASI